MLLTVKDVAQRLKISVSCVYQLVETGKLSHHRIGLGRGAIRVSEADVAEFLRSCRSRSKTQPDQKPARTKLKHLKL